MKGRSGLLVALIVAVMLTAAMWTVPQDRTFASSGKKLEVIGEHPDKQVYSQVYIKTEADRAAASRLGKIVEDYGTFVLVENSSSEEVSARIKALPDKLEVVQLDTTISLRSFSFEPTVSDPATSYEAVGGYKVAADVTGDYYLVQFIGPVTDEWLSEVKQAGGEIIQYVPNQAFLVHADASAADKIKSSRHVRWMGTYQAAHKLSKELMWAFGDEQKADPTNSLMNYGKTAVAEYDVAVFGKANLESVAGQLSSMQAEVQKTITLPNNFFNVVRVKLDPASVKAIAGLKDVLAVDPYIPPTREDERAAQIVAGNFTGNTLAPPGYNPLTQFGVDGSGVTVGVVDDGVGIPGDGGFYVTAANSVNGPLRGATAGAAGHGHLQASIIAGTTPFSNLDPTGYNYGRGIAPSANIINIPLLVPGYTGSDANAQEDPAITSAPNGVRANITNNSFGSGLNGNAYDSLAAQYDGFVRDVSLATTIDPLTIVFSAGNQGTSGLTRPKVAKNVISVASSENLRTELDPASNNLEDVSSFSSRGFAADGRVKPDITAPGQAVSGGRSGPDALFGNIDAAHRWSTGTSHASPQVAGAAALFTQFWKNTNSGQNPSPALIKAALINGAVDMTGTGATAPIPNNAEGWGRVNLKNVLNTGVPVQYINQTQALSNPGQISSFTGTVANTSRPVRVSLVWTDPPAIADPALVNNLDLEVTVGGQTFRGNVLTNGLSVPGGTADTLNNVENVFLPAGTSGQISVNVRATALNGDGILGNADTTDQHFALVVFNATPAAVPLINAAGSMLAMEGCTPANNALDPGERVTVSLSLQNTGTSDATNVTATLQTTGGVTMPSAAQNYGTLVAGGPAVSRNFTFVVDPATVCGATVTATLNLGPLGSVSFPFTTGVTVVTTTSFSNTTSISIPSVGIATPYPSNITVSGVSGPVTKVTVGLSSFGHTFPDDVDVLLVSPTGQKVVIFSDVGGSTDAVNLNFTLDDAAAAALPDNGPLVSGTFRPTNIGATDTFAAPAPPAPYGSTLSTFNGQNPNGIWSLYVVDDLTGDSGSFAGGWSLTITTATPVCTTPCMAAPQGGDHMSVYVADGSNNRIQRTTDAGMSWTIIGTGGAGTAPGRFNNPRGVTSDTTDMLLFVADTNNNRIQRSTDGGTSWEVVVYPGTGVGRVNAPAGIVYDEANDVLYVSEVASLATSRIQALPSASTAVAPAINQTNPGLTVFAGATGGTALGKVNVARGLAVDTMGNLYVADTGNNRIQVYNVMTTTWSIFQNATLGNALGKVNGPRGVYVDNNNNVFVADTVNNRIQLFNGMMWSLFATATAPEGVVATSDGNVFMSDTGLNRLLRKPLMGTTSTPLGGIGTAPGRFNSPAGLR